MKEYNTSEIDARKSLDEIYYNDTFECYSDKNKNNI